MVVGDASVAGLYYQAATHLCSLVNRHLGKDRTCIARSSPGSSFNVNAVALGLMDFGFVQSDRNHQAFHGLGEWQDAPVDGLRSVFSVHAETVVLVARADSGIKGIGDIRGKVVNIGNPGSGQRGNAEEMLRLAGLDPDRDFQAMALVPDEAARALIDGYTHAFFYTVGHPAPAIEATAEAIGIRLIGFDTPDIRAYVADKPYFVMETIPAGTYRLQDEDVSTYAVKATLVTNVRMGDETVYGLTRAVFENLESFREFHPAFSGLTEAGMLEGLSAPLHEGAARYYRERGWMP